MTHKMFFAMLDDNHVPMFTEDISVWTAWMADWSTKAVVAHDDLGNGVHVSTVFLAFACHDDNNPVPRFETMVFGGKYHHANRHYKTWDEAKAGHEAAVRWLKGVGE